MAWTEVPLDLVAAFGGIQVVLLGLAGFLGRVWVNRAREQDRGRVDAQLGALKAEWERDRAILQTAIQASSASHQAAHDRRLNAISEMWQAVIHMRREMPVSVSLFDFWLPEHQKDFFTKPNIISLMNSVSESDILQKVNGWGEIDAHRPFLGPTLWSLFYAYRALVGRATTSLYFGFNNNKKVMVWHDDKTTRQLIRDVLSETEFSSFESRRLEKLAYVLDMVETKILLVTEATISGESAAIYSYGHAQRIIGIASKLSRDEAAPRGPVGSVPAFSR